MNPSFEALRDLLQEVLQDVEVTAEFPDLVSHLVAIRDAVEAHIPYLERIATAVESIDAKTKGK